MALPQPKVLPGPASEDCLFFGRKDGQAVERDMIGRARPRLTEAVRIILQENFFPMTAIDLKKQIEARKLNIQRFANPLAVIHVVLKRLVQSGDVAT